MGYICQGWQLWSDHPFYTQKFIDVDVSSDGYTYHPSSQGEIEIDEDVDSEDEDEGEDDGEDGDEDENEEYVDEDKNNDEDANSSRGIPDILSSYPSAGQGYKRRDS
ncbi:uncharacterized protein EURHEDRAFT_412931 [Aspergillus ruber CBS 135680]|uniref:Uncharacterized protein n=1 Tax=Aspergillus ruber (strain CBS 135680) TaxID=1388766 RepID=A0A017SEE5_ASPRC|nr:uncharacterized protein EURHEDRAFT_412931 [Aspergillus ruber CBS 135680]EYE94590.1 hypothetical protein EURHEDRAFT_412931 [Aspergillus ruber CBS 135680]